MSPCRLTTFPLPKVRWVTETPGKYPVPSGAPSARLSSAGFGRARTGSVSYTHLTLPTIYSV